MSGSHAADEQGKGSLPRSGSDARGSARAAGGRGPRRLRVFLRSCNRNDAASKGITATRTLAAEARAAAVPPWRTRVYPAAGTMPRAIHVDSWRLAPPTPPGNSRASAVAGCCTNDAASIRAEPLLSRMPVGRGASGSAPATRSCRVVGRSRRQSGRRSRDDRRG